MKRNSMVEINDSTKVCAEHCDKKYQCLEKAPCCKVGSCVGNSVLFVEKLERLCNYFQEFGYGHVCKCPVRKELYKKFKM